MLRTLLQTNSEAGGLLSPALPRQGAAEHVDVTSALFEKPEAGLIALNVLADGPIPEESS